MKVKELFLKNKKNLDSIIETFKKEITIFEDYELETFSQEKIDNIYNNLEKILRNKIKEIINIEQENVDNVIFILKLNEQCFETKLKETYLHSFSCKKSEIDEKIKEEFTLWNDNNGNRIEHYCYDYTPLKEIANSDVYFSNEISKIQAICVLLDNIIEHGYTEEMREESLSKLMDMLDESIKDIENGNFIDAETMFEELDNDILDGASNEEKESILKNREFRKKYQNEIDICNYLTNRINHKKCISLIEEYYIEYIYNNIK